LNAKGVPSGEILSLEAALNSPQLEHRQTLRSVREEKIGELKLFNLTAKFEKTPGEIRTPPPRLSAHTNEILTGLGYASEQIEQFKTDGVI
jgi:crotonobetainyl-CoA:carnitine CoA-transferase CaiB-like acyl-CoA transferase